MARRAGTATQTGWHAVSLAGAILSALGDMSGAVFFREFLEGFRDLRV